MLALAGLVALAPFAAANHPVTHAAPDETEPVLALVEMATDGYVLQISRPSERVFEVRVLHRQSLFTLGQVDPWDSPLGQYAFERVSVEGPADRTCATAAACDNQGLWLHGLRAVSANPPSACDVQLPLMGCHPPQRLEVLGEPAGSFLRVTLLHDFEPTYVGAAIAVVDVAIGGGANSWVRGFYTPLKLALPLDVLDAVPEPVRID